MRILTIVTLVLCCATSIAGAQGSYLPLSEGTVWTYTGLQSQAVQRTVEGTQLVGTEVTRILKNFSSGSFEEEWWNFWSHGEQGQVLLHGFRNLTAGFGVRYDPPILWIDPAQSSWSTVTTAHDLDTDVAVETLDAQLSSIADVEITVPAGTFNTLFVDVQVVNVDPAKAVTGRFDVLGQRRPDSSNAKRAENQLWYAPGVGLVRESFCCPLTTEELFSYQVVATARSTWGEVKTRYRP